MKHFAKLAAIILLGVTAAFSQRVWDGTADVSWYSYDEADSSFTVSTPEHLAGLAKLVNDGVHFAGKTITLGADIYLNDVAGSTSENFNAAGKRAWTPIGVYNGTASASRPFSGRFDGKNRTVYGLYIPERDTGAGLFGYVNGAYNRSALIADLNLVTGNVTGTIYVGGLVGYSGNYDTLRNVKSDVAVIGATGVDRYGVEIRSRYAGGLVGYKNSSGAITNSGVTGRVEGRSEVGGLVGYASSYVTILDSYATGNVTGNGGNYIGGLVGEVSHSGTIVNCYATGNVTAGGGQYVGGLVGDMGDGTIVNCYAVGNVSGGLDVGGLVGEQSGNITKSYATGNVTGSSTTIITSGVGGLVGKMSTGNITDSYAMGNVTGSSSSSSSNSFGVGGLVGYGSSSSGGIDNCYAVGRVTSSGTGASAGGLVGRFATPRIANSYWNHTTSVQTSAGGVGKTTIELMQRETFVDWDFTNVWRIDEGVDYPTLVNTISVANITNIPTTGVAKWPLVLSGTVAPFYASSTKINWSVVSPSGTGASFSGDTLKTTGAGSVVVRATIVNGLSAGNNYTQDFTIIMNIATNTVTVTDSYANQPFCLNLNCVSGGGTYEAGERVTVSAQTLVNRYKAYYDSLKAYYDSVYSDIGYDYEYPTYNVTFTGWRGYASGSGLTVVFADSTSPTTTFIMPPSAVTVYPQISVATNVSVLTPDRNIPQSTPNHDAAVIVPVSVSAFELTAGPNPVRKTDGIVNIFITGKRVDNSTLTIYDVTGNVIRKITVRDNVIGNNGRRIIGNWDLKDAKGNHVSAGSYLLRGTVKTVDGKRERVSVIVSVR